MAALLDHRRPVRRRPVRRVRATPPPRTMNIPRHAALALTAAVALTGCASITDPAAPSPTPPAHNNTTTAAPGPAPEAQPKLAKKAGNASPQAALNRYASLWSDWTATTIVARQRQLAVIS